MGFEPQTSCMPCRARSSGTVDLSRIPGGQASGTVRPSPTRSALRSGNLVGYRISDPRIMGYLRNNSIFAFGRADRARTSATFREILDAMWLFNDKFDRALVEFRQIRSRP